MSLLFKKDNLKGHTYKLVLLGRSGVCIDLVWERLNHLLQKIRSFRKLEGTGKVYGRALERR